MNQTSMSGPIRKATAELFARDCSPAGHQLWQTPAPERSGKNCAGVQLSTGELAHSELASGGGPGKKGSGGGTGPGPGDGDGDDGRVDLITRTKPKTKKPSLYKVLLLNDDYTPMEFVVEVLERFFTKGREDATRIMLHVHHKGVGICGVFTYEIAETKVTQVTDYARQNQHPLQCTMEKE